MILSAQVMAASDWAVIASVTAPHLLYAVVWFLPELWSKLFPRKPIAAFKNAALLGKGKVLLRRDELMNEVCAQAVLNTLIAAVLQFAAVLTWTVKKRRQEGKQIALEQIPLLSWAAFFALLFIGQVTVCPPVLYPDC